MFKLAFSQMI